MARHFVPAVLLVAAVAHVTLAARVGGSSHTVSADSKAVPAKEWKAPWFCHDIECPEYEVVQTLNDTIEVRHYAPSTWASTEVKDISYDGAVREGFWRLFGYISGENEGKTKIEMTAPVKVRAVASQGPFCESKFIISFFISPSFEGKPPAPSSDLVFIDEVPETTYYVSSYGGFSPEKKVVRHAHQLQEALEAGGLPYNGDHFFSAGYDSPFRLVGRHNEIWVEQQKPQP